MKKKLKKIGLKAIFWFKVVYLIAVIVLVVFILIIGFGIVSIDQLLQDGTSVNKYAILIAILSLPGITVQLIELVFKTKQRYSFEGMCPKFKHLVECKLIEIE